MKLRVDFNQNPNIKRFLSHLERQINLANSKDQVFDMDCVFPNHLITYQLTTKNHFYCALYKKNNKEESWLPFYPGDDFSFKEIEEFVELFNDNFECEFENFSTQDAIEKIIFINKIFGKVSKLLAFC